MGRKVKAPPTGSDSRRATRHNRHLAFVLLLVLLACAGIGAPGTSAAVTPKGVNGYFGSTTGNAAGQMSTPRGIAVKQSNGTVYAVDGANNRVVVFNSSGVFQRAFGADVVASGPGQANEVQALDVAATSGNFTLTFNGQTTANLAATASAAEVQSALNALASIGGLSPAGSVSVSGGPGDAAGSTPYRITFGGSLAATNVAQITATNVSLAGGSPSTAITAATQNEGATGFEICVPANGDTCKAGLTSPNTGNGGQLNAPQGIAVNETSGDLYVTEQTNRRVSQYDANGNFIRAFGKDVVVAGFPGNVTEASALQTLTVTATGGKYKLKFGGKETAELAFNSSAATIQTALTGLTSIGAANATVSETSSGVFKITFAGALANNPEPLIETISGPGEPLGGGSATIVNTTTGSNGAEICNAASGAVCKQAAAAAATGGNFAGTMGYPAVAPAGSPNAGDLLVADPANLRVQEFSSAGAFVRAFGFDVIAAGPGSNGTAFEVCSAANGDACKIGITGAGSGQFANSVNRVAEDADGNIYTVESATNFRVQKFTLPGNAVTPQGVFSEANLKGTATTNAPLDVAIDPMNKDVLVTKAFAAGTGTPPATVAERRIVEVSQAGALEGTHMANAGINVVNGIAVRGSSGDVFVASTTGESRLYVLNTPLVSPSVGITNLGEISAHSATVFGFVNPNGPATLSYGLTTSYYLAFKRSSDPSFSQTAELNVGRGTTNQLITKLLASLEANTSYDVKLVASRPFGAGLAESAVFSFATPAAPAEVGVPSATTGIEGGEARAALWGVVNPNSQATTYRFQYGTTAGYGTSVPALEASVGSGAAEVPVAQYLSGLQPDTIYHFRIVAKNPVGSSASADRTFTTPPAANSGGCPNEAVRVQQDSTYLPDCRGFELVSPANKEGAATVGPLGGFVTQIPWQTAPDGNSFIYPIQGGFADSTAGGYLRQQANRTPAGWLSEQISAPSLIQPSELVNGFGPPSQVLHASPDLGCSLLQSFNPLTDDTPKIDVERGVFNLYRRNADGSYDLISNRVPLNPEIGSVSNYYVKIETSEDCSRIFFQSPYEFIFGASGLYEWREGTLRDSGALSDGTVGAPMPANSTGGSFGRAVPGGQVNNEQTSRENATSNDGSRFFFTAISDEGPSSGKQAIFMRENGGARVLEISRSQTAVPTAGARYEAASPAGGKVFFRANYGIAARSSTGSVTEPCGSMFGETTIGNTPPIEAKACDLYVYDTASGDLTDLSADANAADPIGAAAQGMLGVSDDGSYVYFAAMGQLVPGKGRTYAQNVAGEGSANVYLSHNGSLSYVATLSRFDLNGGITGEGSAAMRRSSYNAEVSADGRSLIFESIANLTGYVSGGGKAVYMYSADLGALTCVSCRLDGQPTLVSALGKVDSRQDTPHPLSDSGISPKISSDGGRIFFTSPDALAPGAVTGKRNVYEWERGALDFLVIAERGGAGSVLAAELGKYLGASPSGEDVFIGTSEQLVPQDRDFISDVYDVRVGGGFAVEPEKQLCQVDESIPLEAGQRYCQGDRTLQPGASSPGSAGFVGSDNPPQSRPVPKPCPKGKVRRHGRCVKKHAAHKTKHGRKRAANANRGGAK